jgi:hypothetical protein
MTELLEWHTVMSLTWIPVHPLLQVEDDEICMLHHICRTLYACSRHNPSLPVFTISISSASSTVHEKALIPLHVYSVIDPEIF